MKINKEEKMITTTTCIVGYVDNKGNMFMGGDSAGVGRHDIRIRSDVKVFQKENMLMGYTSSFRMGQLLRFKLEIPVHKDKVSDYEYMCTEFIDAVRKCLKDNGYSKIEDNQEEIGTFLVGYNSKIYKIVDDLQVAMTYDNYDSCGCGESYALGSIYTNSKKLSGKEIVRNALECAENFSAGVRRPFIILELKKIKC